MGGSRGDYRGLVPAAAATPAAGVAPQGFRPMGGNGTRIDTEQLWKFVGAYDYVSGDFMWTGIDYLGEARWPAKASSSGAIDTCGFKKDGFYFYRSEEHTSELQSLRHLVCRLLLEIGRAHV